MDELFSQYVDDLVFYAFINSSCQINSTLTGCDNLCGEFKFESFPTVVN